MGRDIHSDISKMTQQNDQTWLINGLTRQCAMRGPSDFFKDYELWKQYKHNKNPAAAAADTEPFVLKDDGLEGDAMPERDTGAASVSATGRSAPTKEAEEERTASNAKKRKCEEKEVTRKKQKPDSN